MLHALRRATAAAIVVLSLNSFVGAEPTVSGPLPTDLLPTDPALVSGKLDNGLKYIVRKHANPQGRAVMWIHFDTGSLNETEQQRGIAHYLEHMAFNGSDNYPPGSLIPFFQSLGMQFGRDQNAFTGFDQTVYQLSLPNTEETTLDKGLTFFADVAGRLTLSPGEIYNERGIIQEERRTRLSGRQRVTEYVLERTYPDSLFGRRLPIGTEKTIQEVQQADFQDYYNKWYGAANATLIVVADADPAMIVGRINEAFSALPEKQVPPAQDAGVKPYAKSFAVVATDPEVRGEELEISRIDLPKPPVTTVALYRDQLVGSIGRSAWNDRVGDKVSEGDTAFSSARVSSSNSAGAVLTTGLSTRAKPGKWKEALAEAATELQRARLHGFTQREIDSVKKEIISGAEWAVDTTSTATAGALIRGIASQVNDQEPSMSPEQRLELLQKLLPTITEEEISKRFAADFDFSTAVFVAILPSSGSTPSEAELLDLGLKSLSVRPDPDAEVVRASELLAALPTPGTVVEGGTHERSEVWSGWLSNGVRVHHRFMDNEKDQVSVGISLIGGELLETAGNRGITTAAALAWGRPATKQHSSTTIRDLMAGKKVAVRGGGMVGGMGGGRRGGGGAGGFRNSINLSISGSPSDLETGFQLAYLLLTEPKLETPSFLQFQSLTKQMLAEAESNPLMAGARAAAQLLYPNEPRFRAVTPDDIDHLTAEAAQAWLEKLISESPIEVTIVGDLDREKSLELATRYLGALPARERVSQNSFAALRRIERVKGAQRVDKAVETPTKQAFVSSAFYGADETNRDDARALSMASRILSTRMTKEVREEAQLVYSIGASSRPGSTFSGFGTFGAAAPTEPEKADALVAKLASMYDEFAKNGPTENELVTAKKQIANQFQEQVKQPGYWSGVLGEMTFRNGDLDAVLDAPAAYDAMTAKTVQDVFAKYYSTDNSLVVVVKPGTGTSRAGE